MSYELYDPSKKGFLGELGTISQVKALREWAQQRGGPELRYLLRSGRTSDLEALRREMQQHGPLTEDPAAMTAMMNLHQALEQATNTIIVSDGAGDGTGLL